MIPDNNEVMVVQMAWCKMASILCKHPIKPRRINSHSKLFINCKNISDFCKFKAITAEEYVFAIQETYTSDWVSATFNTPYLPFPVMVSPNNLTKAHRIFLDKVESKLDPKKEAETYIKVLKDMPSNDAIELVRGGFCGLDVQVQDVLIEQLSPGVS